MRLCRNNEPKTNRTRIRRVDLDSYTYGVARAYMIRLEKSDFDSPAMLASMAEQANMSPEQFRERFQCVVDCNRSGGVA